MQAILMPAEFSLINFMPHAFFVMSLVGFEIENLIKRTWGMKRLVKSVLGSELNKSLFLKTETKPISLKEDGNIIHKKNIKQIVGEMPPKSVCNELIPTMP